MLYRHRNGLLLCHASNSRMREAKCKRRFVRFRMLMSWKRRSYEDRRWPDRNFTMWIKLDMRLGRRMRKNLDAFTARHPLCVNALHWTRLIRGEYKRFWQQEWASRLGKL
jgi:hypothetical protein